MTYKMLIFGEKRKNTNLPSVLLIQQLPRHIVVVNNLHVVYSAAIDMNSLAEGIFPKPVISHIHILKLGLSK